MNHFDGFGVGTKVGASADAPYTDFVYKLVEYDGKPVMKLSDSKSYMPGAKQVVRYVSADGYLEGDIMRGYEEGEIEHRGEALLQSVVANGRMDLPLPSIEALRTFHAQRIDALPEDLRGALPEGQYRVGVSDGLTDLGQRTKERLGSASSA